MHECSPVVPLRAVAGRPRHRAARPELAFVQVSGGCGIRTHGDASTPQRFSRPLTTVFWRLSASMVVLFLQVTGTMASPHIHGDLSECLHECSPNVLLRGDDERGSIARGGPSFGSP